MKTAEKISLKVNPPKPERESNRRRKKKNLDDDFIDLSDPSSLYLYDWNEKKGGKKQARLKHLLKSWMATYDWGIVIGINWIIILINICLVGKEKTN